MSVCTVTKRVKVYSKLERFVNKVKTGGWVLQGQDERTGAARSIEGKAECMWRCVKAGDLCGETLSNCYDDLQSDVFSQYP